MILLLLILEVALSKVLSITKQLQASSCTSLNNNTGNTVQLGNCNYNQLYSLNLGIGTPSQKFNFQFDTRSNILWVETTNVDSAGFNQLKSTSVNISSNSQIINYLGGQANGYVGNDVVSLTNTNISGQFGLVFVQKVTNLSLPTSIYGIVGMGFSQIPNFLDMAMKYGQINSNTFTLSLQNYDQQSFMYYDDIPSQILSNSYFIPVYNQSYWSGQSLYFTSDQRDLSQQAADLAIFASGTSNIQVNEDLWNAIYQEYFSNCIQNTQTKDQSIICQCPIGLNGTITTYPTFALTLGNIQIYLPPASYFQYNQTINGISFCLYLIQSSNYSQILLGNPLFRQYNITFSKQSKEVGFQGNLSANLDLTKNEFFAISQFVMFGIMILILLYGLLLTIIYRPCYNTYHQFVLQKTRQKIKQFEIPEIKDLNQFIRNRKTYIPFKNDQYQIQSSVR